MRLISFCTENSEITHNIASYLKGMRVMDIQFIFLACFIVEIYMLKHVTG